MPPLLEMVSSDRLCFPQHLFALHGPDRTLSYQLHKPSFAGGQSGLRERTTQSNRKLPRSGQLIQCRKVLSDGQL